MKDPHDVFLSAPDAAELRALLGSRATSHAAHPDDADGELDRSPSASSTRLPQPKRHRFPASDAFVIV